MERNLTALVTTLIVFFAPVHVFAGGGGGLPQFGPISGSQDAKCNQAWANVFGPGSQIHSAQGEESFDKYLNATINSWEECRRNLAPIQTHCAVQPKLAKEVDQLHSNDYSIKDLCESTKAKVQAATEEVRKAQQKCENAEAKKKSACRNFEVNYAHLYCHSQYSSYMTGNDRTRFERVLNQYDELNQKVQKVRGEQEKAKQKFADTKARSEKCAAAVTTRSNGEEDESSDSASSADESSSGKSRSGKTKGSDSGFMQMLPALVGLAAQFMNQNQAQPQNQDFCTLNPTAPICQVAQAKTACDITPSLPECRGISNLSSETLSEQNLSGTGGGRGGVDGAGGPGPTMPADPPAMPEMGADGKQNWASNAVAGSGGGGGGGGGGGRSSLTNSPPRGPRPTPPTVPQANAGGGRPRAGGGTVGGRMAGFPESRQNPQNGTPDSQAEKTRAEALAQLKEAIPKPDSQALQQRVVSNYDHHEAVSADLASQGPMLRKSSESFWPVVNSTYIRNFPVRAHCLEPCLFPK